MKKIKSIPFSFILDELASFDPLVKPMFGAYGLYIGEKIYLILRNKEVHEDANGVWFATEATFHTELKKLLPSMKSVYILSGGKKETNWQMIPYPSEEFEHEVNTLCELIRKKDPRIGKLPSKKKNKNASE